LDLHLDKALPEKFVFAVIKKELAADLYKNRFDLVSEDDRGRESGSQKLMNKNSRNVLASLRPANLFLAVLPSTPKLKNWLIYS
jgi:hypothetical protein